jgi:hypothetical protein
MRTYPSLIAAMLALLTIPLIGCDAAKDAANDVARRAKEAVSSGDTATAVEEAAVDTPVAAPPVVETKPDPQQLVDRFLKLSPRDINDKQVMAIATNDEAKELITELKLSGAPVSPAGLDALVMFPNLRSLDMSGTRHSAGSYSFLTKLNLEVLSLHTTQFNDAAMPFLTGLTELRELTLSDTGVSDQGLVNLKDLKNLEVLRLRKLQTNGASFKSVPCQKLRVLEVGRTAFGIEGWRFMKKMPNLEILRAGECGFGDDALKSLRGCTNLQELYLGKNGITDNGLKSLGGLKKLQKLSLPNNRTISGRGLIVMKKLKQVTMLDINGTMANQQTVKDLVELLPECDIMYEGMTF